MPSLGTVRFLLVEHSPAGGLFQWTLQLADALARRGHEVELLTGRGPELAARHPGVRMLPVLPTWHPSAGAALPAPLRRVRRVWRAVRHVEAWRRVVRHVRRTRPDVVQLSEWRFPVDAWAALAVGRAVRAGGRPGLLGDVAHTPVPFTEDGDGGLYKSGGLLLRSLRRAYAGTDVVLVLGERSREGFVAAFPDAGQPVVVPHGDEGIYAGEDPGPAAAGEYLLFFGALARYKGLDLLLDAVDLVVARRPGTRVVVAGPCVDVDLDALRRRCATVPGVELRAGYVPVADVPALVAGARALVTPYLVANASGVVHLAHTLRRPVVTTDVGDLAAAVGHGRSGVVCPPGDAAALAAGMLRLLEDPATATDLGDAGYAATGDGSAWDDVAGRVAAAYLARQRPGAVDVAR